MSNCEQTLGRLVYGSTHQAKARIEPPISLDPIPVRTGLMFVTERLPLAIFLHATQRLPFSHCEVVKSGKVRFVFDDQEGLGPQLELEFDRGAAVAATSLFASQKYLRRKMSETLKNRRNGEYHVYGKCSSNH